MSTVAERPRGLGGIGRGRKIVPGNEASSSSTRHPGGGLGGVGRGTGGVSTDSEPRPGSYNDDPNRRRYGDYERDEGEQRGGFRSGSSGGFGDRHNDDYNKPMHSRGQDSQITCNYCHDVGHIIRDCPEKRDTGRGYGDSGRGRNSEECFKCHEEGHIARDCPNSENRGGSDRSCFKCGQEGHFARDCINEDIRSPRDDMVCHNCDQPGHRASNCTEPSKDGRKPAATYEPDLDQDDDHLYDLYVPQGAHFEEYNQIDVKVYKGEVSDGSILDGIGPIESFGDVLSDPKLQSIYTNVRNSTYKKPTPIQKFMIPLALAGNDVMGIAQTGSGKTAAFLLPILIKLMEDGADEKPPTAGEMQEPLALILAPSRELAIQNYKQCKKLAQGTNIMCSIVYGGVKVSYASDLLRRGCTILVATCGRLLDFVGKQRISFEKLRYLVFDEADRMLENDGFLTDIEQLRDSFPDAGSRLTLMCSATFPDPVQQVARDFMKPDFSIVAVGKIGGANTNIKQEILEVHADDKKEKLMNILQEDKSIHGGHLPRTIVFVERRRNCDALAVYLTGLEFKATSIHGDREQREREEALNDFTKGDCEVLLATNVAARGLDIPGVEHVINYDIPNDHNFYVHRIGRTGRIGNEGRSTTFFDPSGEVDKEMVPHLKRYLADTHSVVPNWLENIDSIPGRFGVTDNDTAWGAGSSRQDGFASAPAEEEDW